MAFAQLSVGAGFLLMGLFMFDDASSFEYMERTFVLIWKIPLTFFLVIAFCIGWWLESLFKNLIILNQKNITTRITVGFGGAIIIAMILAPFIFIPIGFFSYSISAIGSFIISGFSFHASANILIYLDYIAKLQSNS